MKLRILKDALLCIDDTFTILYKKIKKYFLERY